MEMSKREVRFLSCLVLAFGLVMLVIWKALAQPASDVVTGGTSNKPGAVMPASTADWKWEEDVATTSEQVERLKRELRLSRAQVKALQALLSGQPKAALAQYDALLKQDPKNAEAKLERAEARADSGDQAGAIEDMGETIEQLQSWLILHPTDRSQGKQRERLAHVYGTRGSVYMNRGMNAGGFQPDLKKAMLDFEYAISNGYPKPILIRWQQVMILAQLGNISSAEQIYTDVLRQDPKLAHDPAHETICKKLAGDGSAPVKICQ